MARTNFRPDPSIERFEAYMNFVGGLNSETSNETLREYEFTEFENLDLSTRGSAKRRTGRKNILGFEFNSNDIGQGFFFYYTQADQDPDRILAINGKLYRFPHIPWSVTNETPSGTINGTNTVFTVANPFITPAKGYSIASNQSLAVNDFVILINNEVVKYTGTGTIIGYVHSIDTFLNTAYIEEFVVKVNGTETTAFTLNKRTGVITFNTAPSNGSTITVTYKYNMREIVINGLGVSNFQTTYPIEAVQYKNDLYVATGTKLSVIKYVNNWSASTLYYVGDIVKTSANNVYECTITGTSGSTAPSHTSGSATNGTVTFKYLTNSSDNIYAKVVDPYKPNIQEAIYIGTNALADNPSTWIQNTVDDTSAITLAIYSIIPSPTVGIINQPITFTMYGKLPSTIATFQGKWEYKKSSESTWTEVLGWTDFPNGKDVDITFQSADFYDIRASIRDKNTISNNMSFLFDRYEVKLFQEANETPLPNIGINSSTRIRLHWDRLILYGSSVLPTQIFISDLNAPNYFPTTNSIDFEIGKKEGIVKIVRYRSDLIIFTRSSVQGLYGTEPANYNRKVIHDSVGAIAAESIKVIRDDIFFLSDHSLYRLYPTPLSYENLRITRLDEKIHTELLDKITPNASALVYDNQYWLCLPESKVIYRYYYDIGSWTKDASNYLNIIRFGNYADEVYNFTKNGNVWEHDYSIYYDIDKTNPYTMTVATKFLDLGAQFNYKKLRRLYVLARHFNGINNNMSVTVYADSTLALNPESGYASVDQNGYTVWNSIITPNMNFFTGTDFGTWLIGKSAFGDVELSVQRADIRGKSRRVKVKYVHNLNAPFEIYGFGLEFKIKKV